MPTTCPKCKGKGEIISGLEARNMRVARKLTLAELSRRMGITFTYLSQLELDKKEWNAELEALLRKALKG